MDGALGGALAYLAIVVTLLLGAWSATRLGRLPHALRRFGRTLHLVAPEPERPAGPPIEAVAADLRRLHVEVHAPRPGTTMARRRGIVAAYDDTAVLACRALGIPTTLLDTPEGIERESERLRVEFLLQEAGVALT